MVWSNCFIWARWQYCRRLREWIKAGKPEGQEPYLLIRPSRSHPRWVPHFLIGQIDPRTDAIKLESFKPAVAVDVPIWLTWTRCLFRGRVQQGDKP